MHKYPRVGRGRDEMEVMSMTDLVLLKRESEIYA